MAPRNILITGGTSGIGLALVARLAPRHNIITTGRKMTPELKALVDNMPSVEFAELDFMQLRTLGKNVEKAMVQAGWEHVDNAIMNAGTGFFVEPHLEDPGSIRQTIDVNLNANIILAHHLFDRLKKRRGKITFIGSTAYSGRALFASYAASKAGLHGLARALREEWRGRVAVQILHVGPTRTGMHEKAGLNPGLIRNFFSDPKSMAAMIEKSVAGRRFNYKLTSFHDWAGSTLFSRGLR